MEDAPQINDVEAWLKEEALKREAAVQEAQKRLEEAEKNLRAQQARSEPEPTDADAIPPGLERLIVLRQDLPTSASESQRMIAEACDTFRDFLIEKNKQYGDSAIDPVRIFSKASPEEQLLVRMDDKLSRLVRGNDALEPDEDIIKDLLGYWILLQVVRRKEAERA